MDSDVAVTKIPVKMEQYKLITTLIFVVSFVENLFCKINSLITFDLEAFL